MAVRKRVNRGESRGAGESEDDRSSEMAIGDNLASRDGNGSKEIGKRPSHDSLDKHGNRSASSSAKQRRDDVQVQDLSPRGPSFES